MSTDEGSNWPEKLTVAGLPSSTGPLFDSVAVGATLLTATVSVYSVEPSSLSKILARTVMVPLSLVGHVALAAVPSAP